MPFGQSVREEKDVDTDHTQPDGEDDAPHQEVNQEDIINNFKDKGSFRDDQDDIDSLENKSSIALSRDATV